MSIISETAVALRFYDAKRDKEHLDYSLPEEQRPFTALPYEALQACEQDRKRMPITITVAEKSVGFFVLHHGSPIHEYTSSTSAFLLRAFSVDPNFQGRGYAKQAMLALPVFIRQHFPNFTEVVLAVNFNNKSAKALYEKVGFQVIGMREGKKGPQDIMRLLL
ncbi:N-acetyltransferase [Pullulanibacillus camelliae]|uniref:N-acetyltransferase n=1 Tax=Pullulanibacillus camelliae TaxID=1707096 RepID=A0A8J2YH44_9BACL|nr:GNAT family N-acetyltransferase [Pullulanibacillus camelliae]GGE40478.1 N-acetyltransferase [Pullulanibacillus camelliae]